MLIYTSFARVSEGRDNNVRFNRDRTGRKQNVGFQIYMEGTIVAARKSLGPSTIFNTLC